jgi:hypothetical protein
MIAPARTDPAPTPTCPPSIPNGVWRRLGEAGAGGDPMPAPDHPTTHDQSPTRRSDDQAPTRRQLAYLRTLAERTGTTFTIPATRRHASRQIQVMRARPRSSRVDRDLDRHAIYGGDLPLHR